jgi:PAS domain S-box-containing protein
MKKRLRILIAEDSEDDALLLASALRRTGLDLVIERVETKDAMRTALLHGRWDTILADYNMPQLDVRAGLALAREFGPDIPFIVVSGFVGEEKAVELMHDGAADLILKGNLSRLVPAILREMKNAAHRGEQQTRQNEVDQILRKSEERFRRVVESAPNAMVMINSNGRIEMVNTQAECVFGYPREEMLGHFVEMLLPERFRRGQPGLWSSLFFNPQSRPMGAERDLFGLKKDGSEFPIEIGLNPIETDEGTMVLSAIVDISDRKREAERIDASLKEKDILLGEIHHRVKNNLQIVRSLLDLQSSQVEDVAVVAMFRESQNRITSMSLIHQSLYESKDFARVDFRGFLDALVPALISSYRVGPDRVSLSINSTDVQLPINAAIPCALVVNELISNALKHAFPNGLSGRISINLAHNGDNEVMLSVADDGIGIPKAFDIAQAATLGLQLVSVLVEQLGGRFKMQRANPTCFTLYFPIDGKEEASKMSARIMAMDEKPADAHFSRANELPSVSFSGR